MNSTPTIDERTETEVKILRCALRAAEKYISGVNADWPKGQDDDRDELLERIAHALAPGCPETGDQPDAAMEPSQKPPGANSRVRND